MARTLLFLSADSFLACSWHANKISDAQTFSNDSNGREGFARFLENHRQPAYLLVDVIEEDFRLENVPHLIGHARKQLLARKFEQYYRTTPFRQARLLHRQQEGRRDDEMLFSALTNPARISPWLDTLHARHIPLVGIYSLPNICTALLDALGSDHVLLLSWEKNAGLRQTYFHNKRLHFSRLIPINTDNSFSTSVATETPRTQQYLKSLSLPPPGEALDAYVICHADDRLALESSLISDSELHYAYLDIQALGQRFKAKNDYPDSDATALFLHLLAARPPASHYANSEHTHFHLLYKFRRVLYGLAAATALASLLWSSSAFWEGNANSTETEPIARLTERLQRQAQQVHHSFTYSGVPATDMKTAVLLTRKLDQYSPPPEKILQPLTMVLNRYTQIKIDKLAWQTSTADSAASGSPAQVITLDGTLQEFGSDYRKALGYLEHFQQALVQQGYTVSVLKLPLDISSQGSISDGGEQDADAPALFSLKIIWRQPE